MPSYANLFLPHPKPSLWAPVILILFRPGSFKCSISPYTAPAQDKWEGQKGVWDQALFYHVLFPREAFSSVERPLVSQEMLSAMNTIA